MTSTPITFLAQGAEVVRGVARGAAADTTAPAVAARGTVKQRVELGTQRAGGADVRMTAVPGADLVVLRIADGPVLTLHPDTARALLLAQSDVTLATDQNAIDDAPGEVRVTGQLQWKGLEDAAAMRGAKRGFLGRVVMSAIEIVTGVPEADYARLAAGVIVQRVDDQVDAGVYQLVPTTLPPLKGSAARLASVPAADGPLLVLIHGTFSNTSGTFSRLWTEHPQHVRSLFACYGNRVYGLEHATLGKSPIANALDLVRTLPDGARLHLLTHSRGGLVAEVLARACGAATLSAEELGLFAGADYAEQRADLETLHAEVRRRGVTVERVVRVACPARGTLLASGRLDAYLSVLKWGLERANIPVLPALVDFLGAVAQRRTEPAEIPGLAAQVPDSPLIRWLHAAEEAVPGDLRVVAGDLEGDSVTSWIKTLLSDGFFWTDNDLVVQTRSMYGGVPRANGAGFLLDQGGTVSHFTYFSNARTATAITEALMRDDPAGFRVIGPLSWSGQSATGERAARLGAEGPRPDLPAVFILPGILGSNLKVGDKRIWLSWRLVNGLGRLAYTQGAANTVMPDGPIGSVYDNLARHLRKTHEVLEFAYDWRLPIEQEARRLAQAVDAALAARAQTGTPVQVIAHSMGGLVVRTLQLECPEVWTRMMSHTSARLLMLGTPNGGSWAPMQCLSGDDSFGNMLAVVGAPFHAHEARQFMAGFPGFLQLQADLVGSAARLADSAQWRALQDEDIAKVKARGWWHNLPLQFEDLEWGIPPQAALRQAIALRERLDLQAASDFGGVKSKMLLVVGKADFTPDGYRLGPNGLVYLDARDDGDGRVTMASARQLGVRTWQIDCEHGDLPDFDDAFAGYVELLLTGVTDRPAFTSLPAAAERGVAKAIVHVESRPSRTRMRRRLPQTQDEVLKSGADASTTLAGRTSERRLHVQVLNCDLTFVREPLMLGHYRAARLTGTESVINVLTGRLMEQALKVGIYPVEPGDQRIFANLGINPHNPLQHLPRPEAVIVAGLGEEGKLRTSGLTLAVRQAVIAWSQRLAERNAGIGNFVLASTLIGSGGSGISAGQSAQAIAQGVRDANARLAAIQWPVVSELHLIELYLDRATDAWRALQVQATAAPLHFTVGEVVIEDASALQRPLDSGYRGADYDFISVQSRAVDPANAVITYSLDTRRARSEVTGQTTQGALLKEIIATGSNNQSAGQEIGRTLFRLLVPVELEPFLGGTTEMVIEVDRGTAGIPWELLDTNTGGDTSARPWAIRSKLIRKLRLDNFRARVSDATPDAKILVIGEPRCDPADRYPRLAGARREAHTVVKSITSTGVVSADQVTALIAPDEPESGYDANAIITTLESRGDWRIVHIAGHGEPPLEDHPRGVVLSNGTFLGPAEIRALRVVPELVFVNCCHLARRDIRQLLTDDGPAGQPVHRPQFAANVAEELIKIGVRCVIAAGWAVDDAAACSFAHTFYVAIMHGARFMDAVARAREAACLEGGNTWAAYQCYGDPDWVFAPEIRDAQQPDKPLAEEFSGIASSQSLILALETLAVRSTYQRVPPAVQAPKLHHLEARFAARYGARGDVAEAFAHAWASTRDVAQAIEWYERAVVASEGTASLRAHEQLANLRVRAAWERVSAACARRDAAEAAVVERAGDNTSRAAAAAELAAAQAALAAEVNASRTQVVNVTGALATLLDMQPSMERANLCGAAHKRLAMIEAAGRADPAGAIGAAEQAALKDMLTYYRRALDLGMAAGVSDVFHPMLNCLAGELVAKRAGIALADLGLPFEPMDGNDVQTRIKAAVAAAPEFWNVAGAIELEVYFALERGELHADVARIVTGFEELNARIRDPWKWSSVHDQLQFVLPRYVAQAEGDERAAALRLRDRVRGYARPAERQAEEAAAPVPA